MKPLYIVLLSLLVSIIPSKKLFSQNSVYDPGIENYIKLPSMIFEVDDDILSQSYISKEVLTAEEILNDDIRSQYFSTLFIQDPKAADARKILIRYLEKDLLSAKEETNAILRLNVTYYDYDFNETAGAFINVLTFGIGNLLGIPNFKSKTIVELELKIVDPQDQLIADYTATAEKTAFRGLYYRKKDERECNLIAIKKAVQDINDQLMQDYNEIMISLK